VSTTITRLYGRAPQGEPLIQKVLHGNWKTVTFIAALRHDRVTAPFVLEGAMNGETFKAYVEQFLAPTLKKGDIVFMDNASVHMAEGVEEAIEAKGAILFYLPAYSPDFNPIEQLFAKLKSMLRKIAAYSLKQTAYTVDSLCKAIASSLTEITRSECAAYLVLLDHKFRRLFCDRGRMQHWHRSSVVAIATARKRRIVAIELGTWRCGRIGGPAGSVTTGKRKFFDCRGATWC